MSRDDNPARHRILIIDDEESTRLLLARILAADLDAEVQLAGTGEQALRLVENYAYDAIMLDLLMPGVGGLAILKEIRAASPNAATPVVVVSQISDEPIINDCMAAGANAYHVKPVRRAELAQTVKKAIAARNRARRT